MPTNVYLFVVTYVENYYLEIHARASWFHLLIYTVRNCKTASGLQTGNVQCKNAMSPDKTAYPTI